MSGHTVELTVDCAGIETAGVIIEIAGERKRQIEFYQLTPAHDDDHQSGELAGAAAFYAANAAARIADAAGSMFPQIRISALWPSALGQHRAGEPRRNLIKAAALIVAEIERLDRRDLSGTFTEVRERIEPDPEKWPTLPIPHRSR